MCLTVIDKDYSNAPLGERWAWKVLAWDNGGLHIPSYKFRYGEWLRAELEEVSGEGLFYLTNLHALGLLTEKETKSPVRYTSGFHVYTRRKDALDTATAYQAKVVRVRVRSIRLEGRERGYEGMVKVLVADEIFIPSEPVNEEEK